jgi:hypothetical protein
LRVKGNIIRNALRTVWAQKSVFVFVIFMIITFSEALAFLFLLDLKEEKKKSNFGGVGEETFKVEAA